MARTTPPNPRKTRKTLIDGYAESKPQRPTHQRRQSLHDLDRSTEMDGLLRIARSAPEEFATMRPAMKMAIGAYEQQMIDAYEPDDEMERRLAVRDRSDRAYRKLSKADRSEAEFYEMARDLADGVNNDD